MTTPTREQLLQFANVIISDMFEGGSDCGHIQDQAVRFGLLKVTHPTEPCNEACDCLSYYGYDEFSEGNVECYRKTYLKELTGEIEQSDSQRGRTEGTKNGRV